MIKETLKKCGIVRMIFSRIQRLYFNTLTVLSPKLNTKARYRVVYGKKINLDNPQDFHEKLLWLKLNCYMNDPLVIKCSDKYKVREYVKDKGCEEILNELIEVYDDVNDIYWEHLPEQFALKWNFGAGMNIICSDKSKLDEKNVLKQMKKWKKCKCWLGHSELHYKYIEKKIICEKYLEDNVCSDLTDYKVYCFHGKPLAILVMQDRAKILKTHFYDINWSKLEDNKKYCNIENEIPKPFCLEKMIVCAEKLSEGFPFVRCDFYIVSGKLFFGELTFTPAGGLYTSTAKINGKDMGEFINLKNID